MLDHPIISIVDDDESVRLAIKSLLNALGFTTHPFSSAEDFLKSAVLRETSCLILDIQMPKMSGIELQQLLVSQGVRTPIIFITAFPQDTTRTRALEAGAICFLSKPFDEKVLLRCINKALEYERR
ncbi:response regulator transcription factor [Microvirga sp. Mcv34]|uniref:response regulator transcription factor n=1 Tax=Microvirga sp. Mcv34 TaxID=2926016 RepID=UPI0021CAC804|nr:response regulator [Microvirga sp. Mcv34]